MESQIVLRTWDRFCVFFCRLKCDTWFYYAYDQIEDNSKFSDVRQRVENIYANTYLQKITPKWNENFTNDVMNATDLPKQEDFYKHYLRGYDGKQRDKILKSYNENNVALSFDEVANANQARIRVLIQGKNRDDKIDLFEVPSKSDDPDKLVERMKEVNKQLGDRAGDINLVYIKK